MSRLLPTELVIAQSLYVKASGGEEVFWVTAKREPGENAEYDGKPISLACELTHEKKLTREFGSLMNTMCIRSP